MKLWLDDIREAPEGYVWVKDAEEAIRYLESYEVTHISLDHDLGNSDPMKSGYKVACYIEYQAFLGKLKPLIWEIHSQNPVGFAMMKQALENADIYWLLRKHL